METLAGVGPMYDSRAILLPCVLVSCSLLLEALWTQDRSRTVFLSPCIKYLHKSMRERRIASKSGNGEREWLLALNKEACVPSIQAIEQLKSLSFISRASDVTLRVRQALKRVRRQNASFVLSTYFPGFSGSLPWQLVPTIPFVLLSPYASVHYHRWAEEV